MLEFQRIVEEPTLQRIGKVLNIDKDAAGRVMAFIQAVFSAFSENFGLDLPTIEALAFMEIIADIAEGKERPIVKEDLESLFPGLARIMLERS